MSEEELLKTGISAAKAGNMKQATAVFAQVVRENPSSEQGWFLLGMSSSNMKQREYCLRRTLTINPNHQEAIKRMTEMSRPSTPSDEKIPKTEPDISNKSQKRLSPSELDALVVKEMQASRPKGTFTAFIFAAGGGCLAAIIVCIGWAAYSYVSLRPFSYMTLLVGAVVGFTVQLINKHGSFSSWILAAALTVAGGFLGNYLVASALIAREAGVPVLEVVVNLPFQPEFMSAVWEFMVINRKLMSYAVAPFMSLVTALLMDEIRQDSAFR